MALIKSALELALERTADIEIDRESLEAKEYREMGMKLVAKLESDPALDVASAIKSHSGKKLGWLKEGMLQVLTPTLGLPANKEGMERFKRLKAGFASLATDAKLVNSYIDQLAQFMQQFLTQKEQMIATIKQKLEPAMKQKEEQLYQQSGRKVRVTMESDPEFSQYLTANLDKLTEQYQAAFTQAREEILKLVK